MDFLHLRIRERWARRCSAGSTDRSGDARCRPPGHRRAERFKESRPAYVWTRFDGIARVRAFWHIVIRRYETEVCQGCGCPVGLVWAAADDVWNLVIGGPAGVRCVRCFDGACKRIGLSVFWRADVWHFAPLSIREARGAALDVWNEGGSYEECRRIVERERSAR